MIGVLGSGHEHGTSLVVFGGIIAIGIIGGLLHTAIGFRKRAREQDKVLNSAKE